MGDRTPEQQRAELLVDLRRIPELLRQLDVTITRTDALKSEPIGRMGDGHDRPLILNDRASERRRRLTAELCRVAHELAPWVAPASTHPVKAAIVILDHFPTAPDVVWMDELEETITTAWGAVDKPRPKMFAGHCANCGTVVNADRGASTTQCRTCGTLHDVAQHREWMGESAEDKRYTAVDLERLLPHVGGAPVKASTIRKWYERGKLHGYPDLARGKRRGVLFRVGDVLALHRDSRGIVRSVA